MRTRLAAVLLASTVAMGCSSSSSSPPPCTGATACPNGGALKACATEDSTGACATLSYVVGSKTFACTSCTDQSTCLAMADEACGIDAGSPGDAAPVESGVDAAKD